jgi:hypothetical protein
MLGEAHAGILFHRRKTWFGNSAPVTMNYAELDSEIRKASARI